MRYSRGYDHPTIFDVANIPISKSFHISYISQLTGNSSSTYVWGRFSAAYGAGREKVGHEMVNCIVSRSHHSSSILAAGRAFFGRASFSPSRGSAHGVIPLLTVLEVVRTTVQPQKMNSTLVNSTPRPFTGACKVQSYRHLVILSILTPCTLPMYL